ncbi:hypothetical protein BS47DRAFT_1369060 [Hydnum rufescens UP504]|uniref:Uncharacterized protein n=1 Tax=Hydnum rufescens UP504 TaxID=1448309 RepID=A0A9P6DMZ3_9AGAM|nr:hypothetical protein BS47DRAFT_1369060 [Hydnum rufescens UP504]
MPTNFSGPMLPSPTTPEAEGEWSTTWSHSEPVLLSSTMPEAAKDGFATWLCDCIIVKQLEILYEELQEEDYYIKYRKFACHLEILDLQESYIKDEQANLKHELIRVQEEAKCIQSHWIAENFEKKALYEELQEEDYIKYKKLACHLEILDLQESYIKDEQANLKCELIWAQEVKHIQSIPLVISQFLRPIDHLTGIVGINNWLELCKLPLGRVLSQQPASLTALPADCYVSFGKRTEQGYGSACACNVAVEGLQAAEDALEFFHCGWPSWLSEAMAASARMDKAQWEVLSASLDLATPYDRFHPHPPPPLKLAHTPNITVGWYLLSSTLSTAAASSANFSTVPNVATNSGPLTGDKHKHVNSGASMPPAKRFKGANLDPMETNPEIVGNEMEGVEHTPSNNVMMDVNTPMEDVDSLFEYSDDKMDVDLNMDDLNRHIRHSMLEVLSLDCNSMYMLHEYECFQVPLIISGPHIWAIPGKYPKC